MKNFELVIFDCDGVLVDSERITTIAFSRVLEQECELSFSFEFLLKTFIGKSSQECLNIIEGMLGHKPPQGIEKRFQAEIHKALGESVTKINGIEKALNEISIPYCVASGGSHKKMRNTLGRTNLLKYFDGKLFSATDVLCGKPYPDIFLYAASKMGCVKPNQCLVIEDSPLGIKAGVAAGMTVFGFSDLISKQELINAGAHHAFIDMGNLAKEISHYGLDI
ncbi:MAG: HAD family phosphatase [Gammaproteobacteria bacterium]